jgi:AcrR family transcriptional regulator
MITATLTTTSRLPGRPRQFDMEATLDKALGVFSERGYHGASISDLTDAMGLTSGSVYKAFKDKRGIFLAAFDHYRAKRRGIIDGKVDAAKTGRAKIRALLDVYADASHGLEGRCGCLVVGSATDLALFDDEAAERVALAFEQNEQLLVDLVRLGKADGSVAEHVDIAVASRTLLCLIKGMRLVGKTGRDHAEMAAVAEAAMKLLN